MVNDKAMSKVECKKVMVGRSVTGEIKALINEKGAESRVCQCYIKVLIPT